MVTTLLEMAPITISLTMAIFHLDIHTKPILGSWPISFSAPECSIDRYIISKVIFTSNTACWCLEFTIIETGICVERLISNLPEGHSDIKSRMSSYINLIYYKASPFIIVVQNINIAQSSPHVVTVYICFIRSIAACSSPHCWWWMNVFHSL